MTMPIMALGGAGVISVAANVAPKRMVAMSDAMKRGDLAKAKKIHYELSPLFRSMFIDTNPIPVKKAVELCGMAGGPVRLPLSELDVKKTEQLAAVLKSAGLMKAPAASKAKKGLKKIPTKKKAGR
jgi:4-hydroxy-tetrahydrodipicolinate synthase